MHACAPVDHTLIENVVHSAYVAVGIDNACTLAGAQRAVQGLVVGGQDACQAAAELRCIKGRQEAERPHGKAHHWRQRRILGKEAREVAVWLVGGDVVPASRGGQRVMSDGLEADARVE